MTTLLQPEKIKAWIEAGLPKAQVIIEGDGAHFDAIVISPIFAGKTRIQRQRLVYATIEAQLADGTIHAISVKTSTPEEWNDQPWKN